MPTQILRAIVTLGAALLLQGALLETAMCQPATPRNTDTYHLFTPPADSAAWQARAKQLREQILVSAGLYPMPAKTPLRPRITGTVQGDGFVVQNVAIETVPGFYLCGNLYRPTGKSGPFPAIVNPHGHWAQGRLTREPDVDKAAPAPAPPGPGKADLVAIGANLARQGFVVFSYDMVGYADTDQVNHKFAGNLADWQRGVSLMGVQLWNSIRAVDYVASLKQVDANRIGVTGASGGGTQTFLLCAVDDRIKAAVPVNMVSAEMQGGCLCENGPGLRVGTDNPEIASVLAPKPLLLVAATGDWTRHVPTAEGPTIRKVYALFGAEDRFDVKQFNYQHNYNVESREAMYAWFGRWLLNDTDAASYHERPCALDTARMHVWTAQHFRPAGALDEAGLAQYLAARRKPYAATLRTVVAVGLQHSLALQIPAKRAYTAKHGTVLVAGVQGDGRLTQVVDALSAAGLRVHPLALPPADDSAQQLWDGFYSCYNRTTLGDRVQAIVNAQAQTGGGALVGVGAAGPWALLARAAWGRGPVAADLSAIDPEDPAQMAQNMYAPCLFGVTDITGIALASAQDGLLVTAANRRFSDALSAAAKPLALAVDISDDGANSRLAAWLKAQYR